MNFRELIKGNAIIFTATVMLVLVFSNTGLILYNNHVLEQNNILKEETEEIKRINTDIWNEVVRNMDVGFRGYVITLDTALLGPYTRSVAIKDNVFARLTSLLNEQNYSGVYGLDSVKLEIDAYQQGCAELMALAEQGEMDRVREEVKKDRGKAMWQTYSRFTSQLTQYENQLNTQAEAAYLAATHRTAYFQIILFCLGVPTLIFMIIRIRRDKKQKLDLFLELEQNNRRFMFDPGTPLDVVNEHELIQHSIDNFKKAAGFVNEIAKGNYDIEWTELNDGNKALNQDNLAGELVQMREQMKVMRAEEERRRWASEGIAQLSEILRINQHDPAALSENVIRFIVKYMNAQQGSLFSVLEEDTTRYLELVGCYAFNRKKYLNKRIELGEGMIGQTYMEKRAKVMTRIPQGYTSITSGLGDATPACLAIVPMVYNEQVEAVIEIAGFKAFEPHQIDWLIKIGEITASSIVSVRTTEKTQSLLSQFRDQTEQMRAQEEELRQNMEEMEATAEEMRRKEIELERRQTILNKQISDN